MEPSERCGYQRWRRSRSPFTVAGKCSDPLEVCKDKKLSLSLFSEAYRQKISPIKITDTVKITRFLISIIQCVATWRQVALMAWILGRLEFWKYRQWKFTFKFADYSNRPKIRGQKKICDIIYPVSSVSGVVLLCIRNGGTLELIKIAITYMNYDGFSYSVKIYAVICVCPFIAPIRNKMIIDS